jgi:TRAP-type C4-dicarboxylate transport system substrate-binding protein
MRLVHAVAAVAVGFLAFAPVASAQKVSEFKIASLAPKGSSWAKALEKGARIIEEGTSGRVKVKFFFSGSQGDERDVVRKMKLGQIDGSAITATGMGLIKGDVRVLELPFLFKNDKELDYVRDKMAPDFEKQFADAGYVLLAWGDVGWTHLYSNIEVKSKAELAQTKMWAWTDDPIVRTFFKRLGVNGVPLGVPDVLPSLQTGLINACYGSPLAAVALQWYTKVKFATSTPINYSIGALVLRKEAFNQLSPEDQQVVMTAGREMGAELKKAIRRDNERAKKAMEGSGIKFVATPDAFIAELDKEGKGVWDELSGGKLYASDLLEKVKKHLADVRK